MTENIDLVNGPALPVPPADGKASGVQTPVDAQDEDDIIDKAWIEKAKQIIQATSGDPHKQSQQLAALKTEYLQKRYHKTINQAA